MADHDPLAPVHRRLTRALSGPLPALPRSLDRLAEWWAGRPPRARVAVIALAVVLVIGVTETRVRTAEQRWGGEPVTALIATRDLGVGEEVTDLRRMRLPPRAVPPRAVTDVAPDSRLSVSLPEGAVLTEAHVDVRGPAAGLTDDLRAVPVPIEDGWGIVAGGWVDVWLLADATRDGQLVASTRPVLEVRDDRRPTALVGLAASEVELVTQGLGTGRLLLTHVPVPVVGD